MRCENAAAAFGSALALATVLITPPCAAECPAAVAASRANDAAGASAAAEACLATDPADVDALVVKARGLAAAKRYDEALAHVERAIAASPNDGDLLVLKIRIVAWTGRVDDASALLAALPPTAFRDPDVVRLRADLAYWRHDWKEAVRRYNEVLSAQPDDPTALRNRGIAAEQAGDDDLAAASYGELCRRASRDPDGCAPGDALARRRRRFRLAIQPGYMAVRDRPDGGNLFGRIEAQLAEPISVGASADYRTRDFGAGRVSDIYMEAFSTARIGRSWAIYGAAGATAHRRFSAEWAAQVEGSYAIGGLQLFAKGWRLAFPSTGSWVLSPAASYSYGPVAVSARYFLSLPDDRAVNHSAFGRVSVTLPRALWSVAPYAGGGGGDGNDYLELRQTASRGFWFMFAGIVKELDLHHSVLFDYVHRDERAGTQRFVQDRFSVGYELRL